MSENVRQMLEQAKRQFESSEKLDITLLDQIVTLMNRGVGEEQRLAMIFLVEMKENPNTWCKVDAILEYSHLPESKYFALQVLEQLIVTRWKALPTEQRNGIKEFIVQLILKTSSDAAESNKNKLFLHKLNLVLVQIVKQDWPKNWPTFISDIVNAAQENLGICINNMNILSLLSEEVFDFGSQNLTQAKEQQLKQNFCGQFEQVFELCRKVLEQSNDKSIVEATLKTLQRFLSWIPVGYVFETNIIHTLSERLLAEQHFRTLVLQCLTEIASIQIDTGNAEAYETKLKQMFGATIQQMATVLGNEPGCAPNLRGVYHRGTDGDQKFISALALFLTTYMREHAVTVEVPDNVMGEAFGEDANIMKQYHEYALQLLLALSRIEDVELFKICLDYWGWLASELYRIAPFEGVFSNPTPLIDYQLGRALSFMGCGQVTQQPKHARVQLYSDALSELRVIMIERMAKPEEVLVAENDQGEVVRELVKDTDSITLYKNMRECLVYLTHLDYHDTETKMLAKLDTQVNGDFTWKALNTLCWAIGSISGSMSEDNEKRFLVTVIRDLLGLVEKKRGKDNKAVIASNIMYVVGQYPRFLRAHWRFLKTVINKLFEFMHESHDGVQDMACDTFIKIAVKCKRHIVILQQGEMQPFIDEILDNLTLTICDLTPAQVNVFYEAVGHVIAAQADPTIQANLIERLMAPPNQMWDTFIAELQENLSLLADFENVKKLVTVMKTNVAACKSIGAGFMTQLSRIFLDAMSLYTLISSNISDEVVKQGEDVLKLPVFKAMRALKRETLVLISTWVSYSENKNLVLELVPKLLDSVLFDYQRNVPAAREPKVLSLLSIIVSKVGERLSDEIPNILGAVFECTLSMINKDMEAFPEHRTNFFQLLYAVTHECFEVLIKMPPDDFSFIVDAVVWAFQHAMRNVAETGLDILKEMFAKVADLPEEQSQPFYKRFYMPLLQHVLAGVADSSQVHVAGLTYYAEVLCALFRAPEYHIKIPLNDANPQQSNIDFVYCSIDAIFVQHFSENLSKDQIRVIIKGFFSFNTDVPKMKNHLRDFLVQIKEHSGEDTSDLFLEEREAEIQRAQETKKAVPGIIKPSEMDDDDLNLFKLNIRKENGETDLMS